MLFNFFNKKNKPDFRNDEEMMIRIFSELPTEYSYILLQLNEGIINGVERSNKEPFPNYSQFSLKVDLLNKYENKKGPFFQIKGIRVFDTEIKGFIPINIDIAYGLIMGYSSPKKQNINWDLKKVDVDGFYIKKYDNKDYNIISRILDKKEIELLNPTEVYGVTLQGKQLFHIKDLEDGDFIAIDLNKILYKVTHDPFEINEIGKSIAEVV